MTATFTPDPQAGFPRLARFTGMEGKPLWVNPADVMLVLTAGIGSQSIPPGTTQMLLRSGLTLSVKNKAEDVVAVLIGDDSASEERV